MDQNISTVVPPKSSKKSLIMNIVMCFLIAILLLCLAGNYVQYQKTNAQKMQNTSLMQQNTVLKKQLHSLNSQTQSINAKVKIYLNLQGEVCNQTSEKCLDSDIARLETKPILATASGGLCLIRDGSTRVPSSSDPDVGKGYAKLTKTGIYSIDDLKKACGQNDYAKLMQEYCAQNKNPVQFSVAAVDTFGGVETSACSSFGCGSISCPVRK